MSKHPAVTVTTAFQGCRPGEVYPSTIEAGETVSGSLAEGAVSLGFAAPPAGGAQKLDSAASESATPAAESMAVTAEDDAPPVRVKTLKKFDFVEIAGGPKQTLAKGVIVDGDLAARFIGQGLVDQGIITILDAEA
jgi:hypothetical protein